MKKSSGEKNKTKDFYESSVSKSSKSSENSGVSKNKYDFKKDEGESPSWYHYLIILGILVFLVIVAILISEWYHQNSEVDLNKSVDLNDTYIYEFKKGNVTYNIHLGASTTDLEKYNFSIEPTKYDVLNTLNFRFSFDTYNGTDNGQVSIGAIKLRRFLSTVYNFNFAANSSFYSTDELTCGNSTLNEKIVTFNPRASNSGVFLDSNGCMMINSTSPNLLPFVVDSFMVKVMGG